MRQLTEDLRAMALHRSGQPCVMRDRIIGQDRQIRRLAHRTFMEPRRLVHDQPHPAARPRLVIGDEIVLRHVPLGQIGLMPGRKDAVADLAIPQALRRKEEAKAGRHRDMSFWLGRDTAISQVSISADYLLYRSVIVVST